jgi:chromate transporter
MTDTSRTAPVTLQHGVSLAEAFCVWLRVAALSFGGPAGQIAVMHRIIVDAKKWVGENRFLHALSYCMLLPGPEAHQLAIYIGWLLHRWPGAIIAGGLGMNADSITYFDNLTIRPLPEGGKQP